MRVYYDVIFYFKVGLHLVDYVFLHLLTVRTQLPHQNYVRTLIILLQVLHPLLKRTLITHVVHLTRIVCYHTHHVLVSLKI